MMTKQLMGCLAFCLMLTGSATAADPDTIELFDEVYKVQRFNYYQEVQFPDPFDPNFSLGFIEAEGVHYLGEHRMLLSTDELDAFLSYKNQIVEVQLDTDPNGTITGLSYVKHWLILDPAGPGGYDLDPTGLSINTGTTGLAAGGNLLVSNSEIENVFGFTREPNDPLDPNAAYLGDWTTEPPNSDVEDLTYVPDPNDPNEGDIYTIDQDGPFTMDIFSTTGTLRRSYSIAGYADPNTMGEPKGLTYLPPVNTYPEMLQTDGGALLVGLDDEGPGLQVFDPTEPNSDWSR